MTFISLRPQPAAVLPETPCNDFTLNRVLHPMDDPEWPKVITETGLDRAECWGRKFEGAKFQYPHLMKCIITHFPEGPERLKVLVTGAYEDPLCETLDRLGASLQTVDPATDGGLDIAGHLRIGAIFENQWGCVLAASTLEHVKDDAGFLRDIVTILAPGGYAFLSCDFKEGWAKGDSLAPTQERMYTRDSLMALTDTIDGEVEWCGERDWQSRGDYFPYAGLFFSFASVAFRKRGGAG